MKRLTLVLLVGGFYLAGCITNGTPDIHEKLNESGDVIERWGNYHQRDDENDFREFLYYDSNRRLIEDKRYSFDTPNPECIITDTALYMTTFYTYDEKGKLIEEKIYFPDTDDNGNVISHTLRYHYDHVNERIIP